MAQLIKLQDYVSRYEWNPYHYPTQFIRLKRQNWLKLKKQWEDRSAEDYLNAYHEKEEKPKWRFLKRKEGTEDKAFKRVDPIHDLQNEKQLVKFFLDKLFPFQMKWATSTISQISYTEESYYSDNTLKYFLQRFPDIYLVMYYPIFNVKKAPIEGNIILISPLGIELISLLERDDHATIIVRDDRMWEIEKEEEREKVLSPLISLRRNERIISSILNKYDLDFPIKKTVLSRRNTIVNANEPYKTDVISKDTYKAWFDMKRDLSAPLKNNQLKVMEVLLNHCQTRSINRPEWEKDDEDDTMIVVSDKKDD